MRKNLLAKTISSLTRSSCEAIIIAGLTANDPFYKSILRITRWIARRPFLLMKNPGQATRRMNA